MDDYSSLFQIKWNDCSLNLMAVEKRHELFWFILRIVLLDFHSMYYVSFLVEHISSHSLYPFSSILKSMDLETSKKKKLFVKSH